MVRTDFVAVIVSMMWLLVDSRLSLVESSIMDSIDACPHDSFGAPCKNEATEAPSRWLLDTRRAWSCRIRHTSPRVLLLNPSIFDHPHYSLIVDQIGNTV